MKRACTTTLRTTLILGLLVGAAASAAAQGARAAVGDTAPDFTLTASDGSSHTLSELRGESVALVVFFRGTW
jgi:cytochrome oxidase Cu insertion factor (SCO1/SenC/PrrC family)